jgi:N-acetylmuramoyl-L-alanine amidase
MNDDIDIMARTLYGEARGPPMEGKVAVLNVILNRARIAAKLKAERGAQNFSHMFGNGTISSACLRKWQFSCWNENDPNSKIIKTVKATNPHFAECIVLAKAAIAGLFVDLTKGSTHYHANTMGFPRAWMENPNTDVPPKPTVVIGGHSFYNNVK